MPEIINPNNLPEDFIQMEIAQVELEKNRRVKKAEFIDNGDGNCTERFWFVKVPIERIRRITGW